MVSSRELACEELPVFATSAERGSASSFSYSQVVRVSATEQAHNVQESLRLTV